MKKRVQKVIVLILVLTLAIPMVMKKDAVAAKSGYYFSYAGVSVTMGSKAKKFVKNAGTPIKKTKKKSCAYDGYDIVRKYSSFILYTYTNSKSGPEFVNGISFLSSAAQTKEGIHFGSTKDQVFSAYGETSDNGTGIYNYIKGKTLLRFQISSSGTVSNVRYVMKK